MALGDSSAQGIGASRPDRGYVGLVAEQVRARTGRDVQVINVSVSGARIKDLLEDQLPLLADLQADLVTVTIGGNDVRTYDAGTFAAQVDRLTAALPPGTFIADLPYFMHGHWERDAQLSADVLTRSARVDRRADRGRDRFGVEPICRVLSEHEMKIAPSTYYAALKARVSPADLGDAYVDNEVVTRFRANRSVYGVRTMWHLMRRAGHDVGRDQVARLMRIAGIAGAVRGAHTTTTTKTTPLVMSVLERALFTRRRADSRFTPTGLVHHSDAGSQYTSLAFTEALLEAGIAGSIGSVGDSLDNALMESTIGLYETELIDRARSWSGRAEVERETASWVHWFNTTSPSRHDTVTAHCGACDAPLPTGRARQWCSDAYRQAAWRRHHAPAPAAPDELPPARSRRADTVYQCPQCETRLLGGQRCQDLTQP